MSSAANDKSAGKVAFASAVFAGFAYVGYSVVKNAFNKTLSRPRVHSTGYGGGSQSERPIYFRRFSTSSTASQTETTRSDVIIANVESRTVGGGLINRPLSVHERIRELNFRAMQFGEALVALQGTSGRQSSSTGIRRARGTSGSATPKSLQCSPWHSPRVLSPVDPRGRSKYRSIENLTSPFLGGRPLFPGRRSVQVRPESESEVSEQDSDSAESTRVSSDTDTVDASQLPDFATTGNGILTPHEAKALTAALRSSDVGLVQRALVTISNCAAFTMNQDLLREAGCLFKLQNLLTHRNGTVRLRATQSLGNLSLNEENIKEMRDAIPLLWAQLPSPGGDEDLDAELTVSTLLSLTNMAVLPTWHAEFIPGIGVLYRYVDRSAKTFQLQSLKLLTNLSCNEEMIPCLLGAQGCKRLVQMLDNTADTDLLLRLVTLIANLCSSVVRCRITPNDIPPADKVASPETMYARIYGVAVFERLQNKAYVISRFNTSEEIRFHANRLIEAMKAPLPVASPTKLQ